MTNGQAKFSQVRCLIFDLDGTLIDSGLDLALSVNATVEKMGRAPLTHEQIFGYIGSGAMRLVEQALGPGATAEECQRALVFFQRATTTSTCSIIPCLIPESAKGWQRSRACPWRC